MRLTPIQAREESFSWACVQAIAAKAGFLIERKIQDFGIDGELRAVEKQGTHIVPVGLPIEFQLKASIRWSGTLGGTVGFSVDVGTLKYLSKRARQKTTPLILLAVCLPPDVTKWLEIASHEFRLRHCCYVHKPTSRVVRNSATETLTFDQNDVFTPSWLQNAAKNAQRKAFW